MPVERLPTPAESRRNWLSRNSQKLTEGRDALAAAANESGGRTFQYPRHKLPTGLEQELMDEMFVNLWTNKPVEGSEDNTIEFSPREADVDRSEAARVALMNLVNNYGNYVTIVVNQLIQAADNCRQLDSAAATEFKEVAEKLNGFVRLSQPAR